MALLAASSDRTRRCGGRKPAFPRGRASGLSTYTPMAIASSSPSAKRLAPPIEITWYSLPTPSVVCAVSHRRRLNDAHSFLPDGEHCTRAADIHDAFRQRRRCHQGLADRVRGKVFERRACRDDEHL